MSSASVESDHQLPARPFAQGLFDDERFQLRDQAALAAELELRVDPILECREAKLGQPAHRGGGERQPVELGERRTAPERKRALEKRRPSGDIRLGARQFRQVLEAPEVVPFRCGEDAVTGRSGLDAVPSESLAHLRDIDLHELVRTRRGALAPETVHDRLGGNDAVCVEQELRKQSARLSCRQIDGLPAFQSLQWAEQAKVRHRVAEIIAVWTWLPSNPGH